MFRSLGLAASLLLTATPAPLHLLAQEKAQGSTYRVQIIGYGGRVDAQYGPFKTYLEASDYAVKWSQDRPQDLRLTKIVEVKGGQAAPRAPAAGMTEEDLRRMRAAIEGAEGALSGVAAYQKEANRQRLAFEQGQKVSDINNWGKVLKEYADQIKLAWENVTKLRSFMGGTVQRLTDAQFAKVNRLIEQYTAAQGDYASQLAAYKAASVASPRKPAGKYTVNVYQYVGGKWVQQEDRTLGTDDDEQARAYVAEVKSRRGWTATSNVPEKEPPPPREPEQPAADSIVGTWSTDTNRWHFHSNGSFQISPGRNRGQWKRTQSGAAVQYSGASIWINLAFEGDLLVDQDGFVGRARLRKISDQP